MVREATGRRTAAVGRFTDAGMSSRMCQNAASIVTVQTLVKSPQGFTLDLTHPFASQTEGFADFLQCLRFTIIETEPHLQDGSFPWIHFVKQPRHMGEVVGIDQFVFRTSDAFVGNNISQRQPTLFRFRVGRSVVQRDGLFDDPQFLARNAQFPCDVFGCGSAIELVRQFRRVRRHFESSSTM